MDYVLGIDSSTTATKALLIDKAGAVVATGIADYTYQTPQPLWAEQDPALWWTGTVTAIQSCLGAAGIGGDRVAAVGLTGQMHGLVLLDAKGSPVRPAILWNDQRSGPECDELRATFGKDRLVATTGNDALTGFTASKLLWVRSHELAAWASAVR